MIDMTKTITPKSDQLNADDLIAGGMRITITEVKVVAGDQPVSIFYKGDDGKPYKPCKSMRRLLVKVWGPDGEAYIGRKLQLFADPTVTWGGAEVGGIRISHMSNISSDFRMILTKTRGKRAPYLVKPLVAEQAKELTDEEFNRLSAEINSADTMAELAPIGAEIKAANFDKAGTKRLSDVYRVAVRKIREES